MRFKYFLFGTVAVLVMVLMYKIDYPVRDIEKDSQAKQGTVLNSELPYEFSFLAEAANLSQVVFYLKDRPVENYSAEHEFMITNTKDTKTRIVRGGEIDREKKELLFAFKPLKNNKDDVVSISLRTSLGGKENSLVLAKSLGDADTSPGIAIRLHAPRSVYQILYGAVFTKDVHGEDIYYYWDRGKQVLEGANPYSCVENDTCYNRKIPLHFPLFYWLSAFSQKLGLVSFEQWISFWRPVFYLCYVLIGGFLWYFFAKRRQFVLALLFLIFWLLNRWTLYVISVGQIEFLAMIFLIISIVTMERRIRVAALLFGISLAIKQVAIFLLPLYLICAWQKYSENRWKNVLIVLFLIVIVPLVATIPFATDNPPAVLKAILFSATRDSEADFGAPAISGILRLHGLSNVAVMAGLMLLVYLMAWYEKLRISVTACMIFIIFIAFNRVIFNQYFIWLIPFIPLVTSEYLLMERRNREHSATQ